MTDADHRDDDGVVVPTTTDTAGAAPGPGDLVGPDDDAAAGEIPGPQVPDASPEALR